MGRSRGQKLKGLKSNSDGEVFWMSLEEAKSAISDKYEFLVDRYERRSSKTPTVKRAA